MSGVCLDELVIFTKGVWEHLIQPTRKGPVSIKTYLSSTRTRDRKLHTGVMAMGYPHYSWGRRSNETQETLNRKWHQDQSVQHCGFLLADFIKKNSQHKLSWLKLKMLIQVLFLSKYAEQITSLTLKYSSWRTKSNLFLFIILNLDIRINFRNSITR